MTKKVKISDVYEEYKLDQVDRQMLNILVEFPAITNEELAKIVGLGAEQVRRRKLRPAFNKAYDRAIEPVEDLLKRAVPTALRRMLELTKSDDKRIAFEACKCLIGPIVNRVTVDHQMQKIKVYKSEVRSDGTLIRSLVEDVINSPTEVIDLDKNE